MVNGAGAEELNGEVADGTRDACLVRLGRQEFIEMRGKVCSWLVRDAEAFKCLGNVCRNGASEWSTWKVQGRLMRIH